MLGFSAKVALRKESVDRNDKINIDAVSYNVVALRKESVDRNASWGRRHTGPQAVALRKESVDRNCCNASGCKLNAVALRKESVDRNEQRGIDKNSGIARRSPQGERG